MGTLWIADRADLTPVFTAIFRRLIAQGCDWRYTFPQGYLVDFGDLDALPLGERLERERQRAELDAIVEEGHREALEAAKEPAPAVDGRGVPARRRTLATRLAPVGVSLGPSTPPTRGFSGRDVHHLVEAPVAHPRSTVVRP